MTIPDNVPLSYPDLPAADRPVPSPLQRLLAAQEANDIAADINQTHDALRRSLVDELFQAVGPGLDPATDRASWRRGDRPPRLTERLNVALSHVEMARRSGGGRTPSLAGLPATREEFDAWFDARARADYDEQREILDNAPSGSWAPELAGSIWSELTDAQNIAVGVATAPLGGANVARVALVEGAAGALTEAAQFERRSEAAERLMLPAPNLAENMMFGALGGAVLGGAFQAGGNALTGRHIWTGEAARAAQAAEAPPVRSPLDTENAIADAATMLANDPVAEQAFGIRTNPAMNPMLTLDGRQSHMTRPDAGANMEALLAGPFARMQEIFGAEVTINDAIARAGTSRERQTPGSRHFHGDALDLDISGLSNEDRLRLVDAALEAGFSGFGFGNGILHVDTGPRRSWSYGNSSFAGRPLGELQQRVASARPAAPAAPDFDAIARRIVGAESGGDPNARNGSSTATGLGQFIESTWLAMIERHRPDLMEGRTRAQILALRTDPDLSMEMTVAYTRDNAARLDQAGFPPTPGNLYLAHFAGVEGAIAALRAPRDAPILTVMSRAAIAANAPIRYQGRRFADFTVAHLIGWARSKMGDTGAAAGAGRAASPAGVGTSGGAASGVWTPTSRGYTTTGQVTTGVRTIDVEYQVVDAATLRAATGDLQPRDRTRAASAEQIADMAARLDPARLMPAPEADRGAPIVGPDGIVESGNGRVAAIREAAARFPERIAAYRGAIRAAGFEVPDDMEVPVLVARRRSDLSDNDRRLFVREANSATVARMSASERAAMDAAMIDDATMARFDPAAALDTPENAGFLRAALARLPQAERAALVTPEGRLNREGRERMNRAIFARAFDDRELLERLAEEQPGELRSLLEALEQAAPSWAALRADIAAGRVAPEFDIGGHVIEAVRIIAAARDIARTSGKAVQGIIDELLADNDLLEGLLSPLTQALVRKMYPGGRVLAADKVADFLRRYADEARKIGQGGGLLDAPGPLDALKAIDPEGFGHLTETGTPRGQSPSVAQPAPEMRAAASAAETATSEADALSISTVPPGASPRLQRILETGDDVASTLDGMTAAERRWLNRQFEAGLLARQQDPMMRNVWRWRIIDDQIDMRWDVRWDARERILADATPPAQPLPAAASAEDIATSGRLDELDTEALRAALGDMLELDVTTIDGQTWTAAQLLDELDADIQAYRVLDTCMLGRAS
ncbi:hypothetical protein [Roseicyclus amphidinii]|uniref:hypothetical protein n=1 Tax=Roseicyclus amphidinii TaxID=3034232 RepID=UPI0024E119F1|nr:hypothetical protein [Roseicyclus sp. Amp-Y-6]